MGDLNGQCKLWGSAVDNNNGCLIREFISNHDLCILNDGSPTRITSPSQLKSCIDLTICSPSLAVDCHWKVLQEGGTSDHLPTLCSFLATQNLNSFTTSFFNKYNILKADWDYYRSLILKSMSSSMTKYSEFMAIITQAADAAIPIKKSGKLQKPFHPWWDSDCSEMVYRKKIAFKQYSRSPTISNYINFKKIRAQARRLLQSKKREGCMWFTERLNPGTSIKKVWEDVRRFSRGSSIIPVINPPLENDIFLELLNNLAQIPDDENYTFIESFQKSISSPFKIEELQFSLSNKKDSSPGMDSITYSMLKNLPSVGLSFLLNVFNSILKNPSNIPQEWRNYLICPIPKNSSNSNELSGWRPIALASCINKTFENMIKNRIEWFVENSSKIHSFQNGFRKGKGVADNILFVYTEISFSLAEGKNPIAVFLDIKGAYDNILISNLYSSLNKLGLPKDLCDLILNILNNRHIHIKCPYSNQLLGPGVSSRGVPQGSPLSPLLFNLACNSLKNIVPPSIQISGYADDLVIISAEASVDATICTINNFLSLLQNHLQEMGLEFSPTKCAAILFKNSNRHIPVSRIHINGSQVAWKTQVKYLGTIFDERLTWKQHIDYVAYKASKGINLLRSLCGKWWGSHPQTLFNLYKAIVVPHFDNACFLYGGCAKTHLIKLDRLQFQAIRCIFGYLKSTPTNLLLSESGLFPLSVRRANLTTSFVGKAMAYKTATGASILKIFTSWASDPTFWIHKNTPLVVSVFEKFSNYLPYMECADKFPCFQYSLFSQISSIQVINFNIGKNGDANSSFLEKISPHYKDFTIIFTDGSKTIENVGFGIYSPGLFSISDQLPKFFSIFSAELHAILVAMEKIINMNLEKILILTDSKSAIMNLQMLSFSANSNPIILKIRNYLHELCLQNKIIKFGWIPSHCGITGNEKADSLANIGRSVPRSRFPPIYYKDIVNHIKDSHFESWRDAFQVVCYTKGTIYGQFVNTPKRKPWFDRFHNLSRKEIVIMSRLRSNHCLTKTYCKRINILQDDTCECGGKQDLMHIFFTCSKHKDSILSFHKSIKFPENVHGPLSLYDLFFNFLSEHNIKNIVSFLTKINISL